MSINVNEIISKVSNLNGEVFIIPNHATTMSHCSIESILDGLRSNVCIPNGIAFDKNNTKFAQTWVCIEDGNYATDNFFDHNLSVARGVYIAAKYRSGFIPVEILKNVKEGDTFSVVIPCILEVCHYDTDEDDERVEFNMTLNLTAAQQKYRYRNFGRFETCLNSII